MQPMKRLNLAAETYGSASLAVEDRTFLPPHFIGTWIVVFSPDAARTRVQKVNIGPYAFSYEDLPPPRPRRFSLGRHLQGGQVRLE